MSLHTIFIIHEKHGNCQVKNILPQGGWPESSIFPSGSFHFNSQPRKGADYSAFLYQAKVFVTIRRIISTQSKQSQLLFWKQKSDWINQSPFLHKQIYNNVFQLSDFHLTINKGCRNIFPHPLLTIVFYSNSASPKMFLNIFI